jgi:integrase
LGASTLRALGSRGAWNRFLSAISGHRWEGPFRLEAIYGLRRSELLGLHWDRRGKRVASWSRRGLGTACHPATSDQTLERLVRHAEVPRLTSHGLRHTAATHMVRHASGLGEIRAAADILGHSPEMLMKTYAHALPESVRTVTDKIGQRAATGQRGRASWHRRFTTAGPHAMKELV